MKKFFRFLKSFDRFGHPISVNYKGAGKYNTLFGFFITLANLVFASEFIFMTLYNNITRNADISSTQKLYTKPEELGKVGLVPNNMQIGFYIDGVSDNNGPFELDP